MEINHKSASTPLYIQVEMTTVKNKEISMQLSNHVKKMNSDLKNLLFLISGKGNPGKKGNLTDIKS